MAETMYAAPGIGLAATQVDVHLRVIVMDISETHDDLKVFINPELQAQSGEEEGEEGCLSVPGIYEKVRRAARVTVRALNQQGEPFTLKPTVCSRFASSTRRIICRGMCLSNISRISNNPAFAPS